MSSKLNNTIAINKAFGVEPTPSYQRTDGKYLLHVALEASYQSRKNKKSSSSGKENESKTLNDTIILEDNTHDNQVISIIRTYPWSCRGIELENGYLPLHTAILNYASLAVIRELILQYPESCSKSDFQGYLPLHLALKHNSSLDIIKTILVGYSEACFTRTKDGNIPLHTAVQDKSKCDLDSIKFLIQMHPEGISFRNNYGRLPIHEALRSSALDLSPQERQTLLTKPNQETIESLKLNKDVSLELITILNEGYYEGVITMDNDGCLPLHYAAANPRTPSNVMNYLLKVYPQASLTRARGFDNSLPIHLATEYKASLANIKALITSFPSGCGARNSHSRLPIHLATVVYDDSMDLTMNHDLNDEDALKTSEESNSSMPEVKGNNSAKLIKNTTIISSNLSRSTSSTSSSIINLLLKAYPDGIWERDSFGGNALFYCIYLKAPTAIILSILSCSPKNRPDKDDLKCLHIAIQKQCSVDVLLHLMKIFPSSCLDIDDESGYNTLHLAIIHHASITFITQLIQEYPQLCQEYDKNNNLPIHLAVIYFPLSDQLIDMLLQIYPEGGKMVNEYGDLPLHCALQAQASTEVILLLISCYPEACSIENSQGELPLHYATCGKRISIHMKKRSYGTISHLESSDMNKDIIKKPSYCSSYQVINALLKEYADAASVESVTTGLYPLHHAIIANASVNTVRLLLDTYPDAIQKSCTIFRPLNTGLSNFNSMNDIYESIITIKMISALPIHLACGRLVPSKEIVKILLNKYPESISHSTSIISSTATISNTEKDSEIIIEKLLPLHIGLLNKVSVDVIQEILNIPSDSIRSRDSINRLPLHIAIFSQASSSVILSLLGTYMHSTKEVYVLDGVSYLPFHLACLIYDCNSSVKTNSTKSITSTASTKQEKSFLLELTNRKKTASKTGGSIDENQSENQSTITHDIDTLNNQDEVEEVGDQDLLDDPIEILRALMNFNPNAIEKKTSEYGDLPIHTAIKSKKAYEIIQYLAEAYPEGCQEADINGYFPLHLSLLCQCDIKIVNILLSTYPEAILQRSKRDLCYPLHLGLETKASVDILIILLATAPEIASEPHWMNISQGYNTAQKRMITTDTDKGINMKEREKDMSYTYAIHLALYNNLKYDFIMMLLEYDREACARLDSLGYYPLDVGIEYGAATEIVVLILEAYPTAAGVSEENLSQIDQSLNESKRIVISNKIISTHTSDREVNIGGRSYPIPLPLHRSIATGKTSVDVIDALLIRHPDACAIKCAVNIEGMELSQQYLVTDIHNYKPSDSKSLSRQSLDSNVGTLSREPSTIKRTKRTILKESIQSALGITYIDLIPLHLAIMSHSSYEVIAMLLEVYPDACQVADEYGRLALHLAIIHRLSFEVISLLIKTYPLACKIHDHTPFHYLPIDYSLLCDETIEEFLSEIPEFKNHKLIPYEYKQSSLEIIKILVLYDLPIDMSIIHNFHNQSNELIQFQRNQWDMVYTWLKYLTCRMYIQSPSKQNIMVMTEFLTNHQTDSNNKAKLKVISSKFEVSDKRGFLEYLLIKLSNNNRKDCIKILCEAKNQWGQSAIELSYEYHYDIKEILLQYYLFCNRFDLHINDQFQYQSNPIKYISPNSSSLVIQADDYDVIDQFEEVFDKYSVPMINLATNIEKQSIKQPQMTRSVSAPTSKTSSQSNQTNLSNYDINAKGLTYDGFLHCIIDLSMSWGKQLQDEDLLRHDYQQWISYPSPISIRDIPTILSYKSHQDKPKLNPKNNKNAHKYHNLPGKSVSMNVNSTQSRYSTNLDKSIQPSSIDQPNGYMFRDIFISYCRTNFGIFRQVILKFMRRKGQYDREKKLRLTKRMLLNNSYILPMLNEPDPVKLSNAIKNYSISGISLSNFKYCIVLPAGDRDFEMILKYENFHSIPINFSFDSSSNPNLMITESFPSRDQNDNLTQNKSIKKPTPIITDSSLMLSIPSNSTHFNFIGDWEPNGRIYQYIHELFNCFIHLHECGILYSDIQPSNIIRYNNTLKLIDLDHSLMVSGKDSAPYLLSEGYVSPTSILPPEMYHECHTIDELLIYEQYWSKLYSKTKESINQSQLDGSIINNPSSNDEQMIKLKFWKRIQPFIIYSQSTVSSAPVSLSTSGTAPASMSTPSLSKSSSVRFLDGSNKYPSTRLNRMESSSSIKSISSSTLANLSIPLQSPAQGISSSIINQTPKSIYLHNNLPSSVIKQIQSSSHSSSINLQDYGLQIYLLKTYEMNSNTALPKDQDSLPYDLIQANHQSLKIDSWQLGCLIYEILIGTSFLSCDKYRDLNRSQENLRKSFDILKSKQSVDIISNYIDSSLLDILGYSSSSLTSSSLSYQWINEAKTMIDDEQINANQINLLETIQDLPENIQNIIQCYSILLKGLLNPYPDKRITLKKGKDILCSMDPNYTSQSMDNEDSMMRLSPIATNWNSITPLQSTSPYLRNQPITSPIIMTPTNISPRILKQPYKKSMKWDDIHDNHYNDTNQTNNILNQQQIIIPNEILNKIQQTTFIYDIKETLYSSMIHRMKNNYHLLLRPQLFDYFMIKDIKLDLFFPLTLILTPIRLQDKDCNVTTNTNLSKNPSLIKQSSKRLINELLHEKSILWLNKLANLGKSITETIKTIQIKDLNQEYSNKDIPLTKILNQTNKNSLKIDFIDNGSILTSLKDILDDKGLYYIHFLDEYDMKPIDISYSMTISNDNDVLLWLFPYLRLTLKTMKKYYTNQQIAEYLGYPVHMNTTYSSYWKVIINYISQSTILSNIFSIPHQTNIENEIDQMMNDIVGNTTDELESYYEYICLKQIISNYLFNDVQITKQEDKNILMNQSIFYRDIIEIYQYYINHDIHEIFDSLGRILIPNISTNMNHNSHELMIEKYWLWTSLKRCCQLCPTTATDIDQSMNNNDNQETNRILHYDEQSLIMVHGCIFSVIVIFMIHMLWEIWFIK